MLKMSASDFYEKLHAHKGQLVCIDTHLYEFPGERNQDFHSFRERRTCLLLDVKYFSEFDSFPDAFYQGKFCLDNFEWGCPTIKVLLNKEIVWISVHLGDVSFFEEENLVKYFSETIELSVKKLANHFAIDPFNDFRGNSDFRNFSYISRDEVKYEIGELTDHIPFDGHETKMVAWYVKNGFGDIAMDFGVFGATLIPTWPFFYSNQWSSKSDFFKFSAAVYRDDEKVMVTASGSCNHIMKCI